MEPLSNSQCNSTRCRQQAYSQTYKSVLCKRNYQNNEVVKKHMKPTKKTGEMFLKEFCKALQKKEMKREQYKIKK